MAKKLDLRKSREAALAIVRDRMTEETLSTYRVASHAKIDWCPCCGVNLRLYDEAGQMFAKLISNSTTARKLGAGLITTASDMQCLAGTDDTRNSMNLQMLEQFRGKSS